MAITLVGEVVNSADATTGFNVGNISGDDDFVEGTGAIGLKASATVAEMYTTTLGATAPYSFAVAGGEEGFHIIMWFNTKTSVNSPRSGSPFAGVGPIGGMGIVVGNGTDRGYWFVDPEEFYKGGFFTAVVSPARPLQVISAGTWTLSGGISQFSNITTMGGVFDTLTSVMGSFNNVQLDQITIGEGLRADGEDNNFEALRAHDEDENFYGWWSKKNGAFVGKGKAYIGPASGSATCTFTDASNAVVFANERVADGFYEINTRGGGTTVTWDLMNISSALPTRPNDVSNVGSQLAFFNVTGDTLVPAYPRFKPDGTEMYYANGENDDLSQRTLSTAWDINSAGSSTVFDTSVEITNHAGLWFKPDDGTEMYYADSNSNTIFQRNLSTGWDISSAGSTTSLDISTDETSITSVCLSEDGTRLFVIGNAGQGGSGDRVHRYTLSTAWDITTAGSEDQSLLVADSGNWTSCQDMIINREGTLLWILDGETTGTGLIFQIPLAVPFDLTSFGSITGTFAYSKHAPPGGGGMWFKPDGFRLFLTSNNVDGIVELSLDAGYRWNLTVQSDTLAVDDADSVWSGADQLVLDDSVALLRTTLVDCNKITLNSADMDDCVILNANTALGEAFIAATTLATMTGNAFTFSEGHAIEITTAGTYSFVGNTFTGYGPGSCSDAGVPDFEFDTITDVDAGAETITISGDPLVTGDPVYYSDEAGSDTIGLTDNTLYYVRRTAASTYQMHLTEDDAHENAAAINLSDGSTGEGHALYSARAAIYNSSGGTVTIQVSGGGSTPSIRNDSDSVTNVENNVALTFSGMKDNTEVRVYNQADPPVELAGIENATVGTADNREVTFSLAAGITVDVRFAHGIAADGFVYKVPDRNSFTDFIWPSTTSNLPVVQVLDRAFDNP